ncbi:isochorismate synthase [Porphyromonas crevioricanis JCM 15906]|uniref:isochorismate synthase n=2 Tax=Porphyromonas crevioricanis TaxID=393921 RepID=A0AB34PGE3_9PORP|nr:isochorismate synthase [Porphyromonas crevioricanis]KGN94656.1 hypothetical protein HQ38_05600 [Porphyromonas crevioricanis]GAD05923.1 isochorismate synthase [Porphyromonas crevioricanis JCM 15906]SJZ57409.1 isochorismate synthase [Porphyromonas crevioricanis]
MRASPYCSIAELFSLPCSDSSAFVLIQMPGSVAQYWHCPTYSAVQKLQDLTSEEGFVFAPFCATAQTPIYFLPPLDVREFPLSTSISFPSHSTVSSKESVFGKRDYKPNDTYQSAFTSFHSAVRSGQFSKLVLSREEVLSLQDTITPIDLFADLLNLQQPGAKYLIFIPEIGFWLGATPEVLLCSSPQETYTMALAGTKALGREFEIGQDCEDFFGAKNNSEHEVVVDHIRTVLCSEGIKLGKTEKRALKSYNVQHLCTRFDFDNSDHLVIARLVDKLHPTPAVCGIPTEKAKDFIRKYEGYERRYYAGYLGYWQYRQQTELYVNLRSASIDKEGSLQAHLYAGGGIMPDSDYLSEWEETKLKMQPMHALLSPYITHYCLQ